MDKVLFPLLLVILAFGTAQVWSQQSSRIHHLRQFNSGQDSFYDKSSLNIQGSAFDGEKCVYPAQDAIENAEVVCSQYSGCRVQCFRGYTMQGSRRIYLNCDSNTRTMTYEGLPWQESLPPCLPSCGNGCPDDTMCVAPDKCEPVIHECDPPCQNGGTCIIQGVCNCSLGYSGLLCQQHRCAIPIEFPKQASIGADIELTRMSIECNFGRKMKNGLSHQTFVCNHRQWYTKLDKASISEVDIDCY
ncbi:uncharacterized protein LOC135221119 [Macrobrachium nipponense]|uniref:uncharacterized protein LOC135221119 n=1 Tax=Macrobrachium nipponense TaxID=159736 RepID=UPI0030C80D2C